MYCIIANYGVASFNVLAVICETSHMKHARTCMSENGSLRIVFLLSAFICSRLTCTCMYNYM